MANGHGHHDDEHHDEDAMEDDDESFADRVGQMEALAQQLGPGAYMCSTAHTTFASVSR